MPENFQIEGQWINKQTGAIVTVSNYVSDGNETIVMTDKGPINMMNFMNNYVQYGDSQSPIEETPIVQSNSNVQASTTIFNQEYTFDDDVTIPQQPQNNITAITTIKKEKINNESIIKKFFDKIENKPQIEIKIDWDDFPKSEISTLINFLDVNIKDIATYIYYNICTNDNVIDNITNILESKLKDDR